MDYNKIFDDKKFEDAYREIYKYYVYEKNKFPVENPVAIVLGGIPGSNKSNIYNFYDENPKYNYNVVRVDLE